MPESRAEKGMATLRRLFGASVGGTPLPPAFAQMTVEHLFGEVWQRPGLALEERSLVTCAVLVALGVAAWLAWKVWQLHRFRRLSSLPQITAAELFAALAGDDPPLLLDLRGATMVAETGPIAGAVVAEHDRLEHAVREWPKDRPIVTLCACPQDAGAIQAARRLLDQGFASVRPLKGGYEAWLAQAALEPAGGD
jgi:rhodanese-related sulfurtransferase